MPIQAYKCDACSHTFDRLLPRAVYDLHGPAPCPHCDAKATPTLNLPAKRAAYHGLQ